MSVGRCEKAGTERSMLARARRPHYPEAPPATTEASAEAPAAVHGASPRRTVAEASAAKAAAHARARSPGLSLGDPAPLARDLPGG